jgi:uncharacterized protein (TIGR02145 family)
MKKIIFLICVNFIFLLSCSSESNNDDNIVTLPVTPTNLTGTSNFVRTNITSGPSSCNIILTWTDNSTNETGFKIERKVTSGTYEIIGSTQMDINSFTDSSVLPNTSYYYRIYSFNNGGNSPTYSNELTISVIFNQPIWQFRNLEVTTYRDGTIIPQVTNPTEWQNTTTGAWCYYNNDPANGLIYGKLYNKYAIFGTHDNNPNTPNKILAPTGWHIPTYEEWIDTIRFIDPNANPLGTNLAGSAMKETGTTHWINPNNGATNTSGFSGLPGGQRFSDGSFRYIGTQGSWHSTGTGNRDFFSLYNHLTTIGGGSSVISFGYSIRCVKD